MNVTNQIEKCTGCHACASICPKQCIQMLPDKEGFLYPHIDESQCIKCGLCNKICPLEKKTPFSDEIQTKAYAVINHDDVVRGASSSGGVFTLLAENILDRGGVVFGAAFNDHFDVEHIAVDKREDLKKLRGSKYVQSRIGTTYIEAKAFLDRGVPVLFTGTPCQIVGLKEYLMKEYENLYTQDIVCHGVPSPLVWQKYVADLEEKYKSKLCCVKFRDKTTGWKKYSVSFEFFNGKKYIEQFPQNSYMTAFLDNLCLRRSCYDCMAKGTDRTADITLADFWGIEEICPEIDDGHGTSLVIIHSKKGEELFNRISGYVSTKNVGLADALKSNVSALKSSSLHNGRETFINEISKHKFDKVVNKHTAPKLSARIKTVVKKVLLWVKK